MKPGPSLASLLRLCLFCCAAAALPAGAAVASTAAATPPADAAAAAAAIPAVTPAPAAPAAAAPQPALPVTGMQNTGARLAAEAPSTAGSLLQTVFALAVVLALVVGLAWFMKRYGPKNMGGNASLRLVGSLSLGGRERIVVVEVADQWIVVGASPGRINALATLPRQENLPPGLMSPQNGLAATNFSEWLKQTIDKRNGK
jgi:flagellar protein FliO/FliZ